MSGDAPEFSETRPVSRVWVLLIAVLGLPGLLVGVGVVYVGMGPTRRGLGWVAGLVGLHALTAVGFWRARLATTVREDGLRVRFFPLQWSPRRVPCEAVDSVTVVDVDPVRDFGGFGIRFNPSVSRGGVTFDGPKAYLLDDEDRAVRVERRGGRPLVVGTDRPGELAAALELTCACEPGPERRSR